MSGERDQWWKPLGRSLAAVLPLIPGVQPGLKRLARAGYVSRATWTHIPPRGIHSLEPVPGISFLYRASVEDQLARSIVWTNMRDWEYVSISTFSKLARRSEGFVDVGAYTGVYSLVAAAANPSTAVLAFEPNPKIFPLLQENLRLNRVNGEARREGIGARGGPAFLVVPQDSTTAHIEDERRGMAHQVVVRTIDEACASMAALDLMKIDVEGAELQVLEGAQATLRSRRPRLLVEALTIDSCRGILEILRPMGYRTFLSLPSSGPVVLLGPQDHDPRHPNILCVPDDEADIMNWLG